MKTLISIFSFLIVFCFASCTVDWDFENSNSLMADSYLKIKVQTDTLETKSMYTDQYLPANSEIGITLLNASGSNYGGLAYQNVKFTAAGDRYAQTWSGASAIKLSGENGYCYGYYPYNNSVTSIKSIPLTTDGTDYMYATPVTANDNNKYVTLQMNHALSVIRLAFKKGNYFGTGAVTALAVSSPKFGNSGTLDATTGNVTALGLNNSISQTVSLTLGNTPSNFDFFVVPSGTAGSITISATIDGKTFTKTVSSTVIEKGNCYTYTVEVNAGTLSVSSIGGSGYDASGNPVITSGSYKVTFAGNFKHIGFSNSVSSNGTVTIKAVGFYNYPPKAVSKTGNTTLSQSTSGFVRTITLSGITTNVTVTFNGTDYPFEDDGVYALKSDGSAVKAASATDASYAGIVVALNGKAYQIAKTDANGGSSFTFGTIPAADNAAFPFYTKPYSSHSTYYGYLMKPDGSYGSTSYRMSSDPAVWMGGSMEEFNGKSRTAYLLKKQGNSTSNTIGYVVDQFNKNSSVNEGYSDWFVPSMGELCYIYTKWSDIRGLIAKVSGFTDFSSNYYVSSSCYSTSYYWNLNFSNGYVTYAYYTYSRYARLVRAL